MTDSRAKATPVDNALLPLDGFELPVLTSSNWQMSFGERCALEGLLSQLGPRVSIELGTAQGGSLRRVCAHSAEVHTFDILEPPVDRTEFPNAEFHVGDSHHLLREVLSGLASDGRNVDFVLVDGDHSAGGVEQDLRDLLDSPAVTRTLILLHDTMNEEVRIGIERTHADAYPKVIHLELELVGGYIFRDSPFRNEVWGGLGLIAVNAAAPVYFARSTPGRWYELFPFIQQIRELIVTREQHASRH